MSNNARGNLKIFLKIKKNVDKREIHEIIKENS